METKFHTCFHFRCFMFKSYYVVWKHIVKKNITLDFKGLNRTMQYGNLETISILNAHTESLNRTMQYGNMKYFGRREKQTDVFKSYYVVWKLAPVIAPIAIGFCLNRTMQYGNSDTWGSGVV